MDSTLFAISILIRLKYPNETNPLGIEKYLKNYNLEFVLITKKRFNNV